ncbi:hypothetical protein MRX96_038641 [Rhipicephalus microplus]
MAPYVEATKIISGPVVERWIHCTELEGSQVTGRGDPCGEALGLVDDADQQQCGHRKGGVPKSNRAQSSRETGAAASRKSDETAERQPKQGAYRECNTAGPRCPCDVGRCGMPIKASPNPFARENGRPS